MSEPKLRARGKKAEVDILLVDDTPDSRALFAAILEDCGYGVRQAATGTRAIAAARVRPPDLILLDVRMPGMDGYEVCARLKRDAMLCEIPIIFISAVNEPTEKARALELGAADFISKPFDVEEAIARVENQLRLRRLQQQLQAQNTCLQETNQRLREEIAYREQIESKLQYANQELERLAALDGLTHLANRRRFEEYLLHVWERAAREGEPVCLLLCDVDYFKAFNDTYGHQAGDECLRAIARILQTCCRRATDLVARYGGEEFAAILPNTEASGGQHVGQFIRRQVQGLSIPHATSPAENGGVTISVGVAAQVPTPGSDPAVLVGAGDRALYAAKARGRNRVAVAD